MIPYTLHVALLVAGCLAFYKVFLQRETFFRLNRWVLLACLVLAFALPLAHVPAQWSLRKAAPAETSVPATAPLIPDAVDNLAGREGSLSAAQPSEGPDAKAARPVVVKPAAATVDAGRVLQWVGWLYWFGVIAFGINFLLQVGLLLYRAYTNPVIRDGRYRIVELSGDVAPCSFANNIFINPEKYDWDTYQQVLEHEKVHCSGRHSWDILLAEIVLVFQWFNPFAWIYRKTLENNLEFLTDEELLERRSFDPSSYQMSLLRVSSPHLPLGLTTNYNQSLLKKRILMMQAKKSNWHTSWKYLFLLPLMALMMCLLNEPAVQAQQPAAKTKTKARTHKPIDTEGNWFATIKGDKVQMQFRGDDDGERSMNGNSFALSDFGNLPRNGSGTFTLKRDAGTMEFTGRFDGDQGMGRYKFVPDESYAAFLKQQGLEPGDAGDRMVLFFVDASRAYVSELKSLGYKDFDRDELIPLAALRVNGAYIRSLREAGLNDVPLSELIPLRSLGVDKAYVEDIRKVYPNVTASRLIPLKAQGIDSKYIQAMRSSNKSWQPRDTSYRSRRDNGDDDNNVNTNVNVNTDASTKADKRKRDDMNEQVRERVRERGGNDELNDIVGMKAVGVDDAYIQSIRDAGFPDISIKKITGFKALGITPDYIKSLRSLGFSSLSESDVSGAKATGVDAAFIRSFEPVGYKGLRLNQYVSLKATGVTPQLVKEYQDFGFTDVRPNDVIGAKSVGVTPAFLREMKAKGYEFKSLNKAIGQKASVD
ncbi:peptidase M56, BlaR1 [Flaviaesturariibacter flavus]|uniref:Peptidase M56, BlaR1 n=1 Tax=Flaviaesturariibacter flavus TaxID=2502780 RepID=A0A4R1BC62_9BACT|nr:M56 family metallopeptidase [Flaviaesturariibacter flavus]TCJ14567.1 peptidase M56, BlaR1 [Flaviaesturariibacter flavus]